MNLGQKTAFNMIAIATMLAIGTMSASATMFDFAPGAPGFPFNPVGNVNTGVASFTQLVNGITLTGTSTGGNISANNQATGPGNGNVGLGVVGNGGTAINSTAGEKLTFTFDMDVILDEIVIDGHANPESAQVDLPGFTFQVVGANTVNGSAPAGTTFLSTNGADATVEDFITFSPGFTLLAGQSLMLSNSTAGGYFVQSLHAKPVPEPSGLALAAVGLLMFLRRRR